MILSHPEDDGALRGIPIGVVRSPDGDYSFGGVSAGRSRLTLVGASIPGWFEATREQPAVFLTRDSSDRHIVAPEMDASSYEHGGAFAVLPENFADLIPYYGAIPIHDRQRA